MLLTAGQLPGSYCFAGPQLYCVYAIALKERMHLRARIAPANAAIC